MPPTSCAKAAGRGADALIVDLEDAVPPEGKDATLAAVVDWLGAAPADGPQRWVRVNDGPRRHSDVAALAGTPGLVGLVLAKVRDAEEVAEVAALLDERGDATTLLMPLLETASAVLEARALAAAPRVHQLQIGEVDLAADTGLMPGEDEAELAPVRSTVVLASAAAGISPAGRPGLSGDLRPGRPRRHDQAGPPAGLLRSRLHSSGAARSGPRGVHTR